MGTKGWCEEELGFRGMHPTLTDSKCIPIPVFAVSHIINDLIFFFKPIHVYISINVSKKKSSNHHYKWKIKPQGFLSTLKLQQCQIL